MIIFYCQSRSVWTYFSTLATYMDEDAVVVRASFWEWLSPRDFLFPSVSLGVDYLSYVEKDYAARHDGKQPGIIWKIMQKLAFRWYYAYDCAVLRRFSPSMAVIWNEQKPRRAIFAGVARGASIPCAFMERGFLPNTMVCDGKGNHYKNSVPRDATFYQRLPPAPAPQAAQLIPRRVKTVRQSSGRDLPARYIFIPFQIDTDSKIIRFSPWIANMRQLFAELLALSEKFPQYQFIFKEHPSSTKTYGDLHSLIPPERGFFANDHATQTLIENAEAVITISSTVGIEAMLFSKKVIVIGQAFYDISGLTLSARNADQLEVALNQLEQFTPDEQLRRNFLTWLKDQYLVSGRLETPDETHCRLIKVRLDSIREQHKGSE